MDLQNLSKDKKRSIYEELKKEFAYTRKNRKTKKDIILKALENKVLLYWNRIYYFKEYKNNRFYFENDKLGSYDKELNVSVRDFRLNEEKSQLIFNSDLIIISFDKAQKISDLVEERNKIYSEDQKKISLIYKEREEKLGKINKEISLLID